MSDLLRAGGPPLLAVLSALVFDRLVDRKGLLPPGFCAPPDRKEQAILAALRRGFALTLLALVLWIGVFAPLGLIGERQEFDPAAIDTAHLFLLHAIFAAALAIWFLLGFGPSVARFLRQFGLRARSVATELALGVGVGVGAWVLVLATLIGLGALVWSLGGDRYLPREPPPMIPWIVSLPIWVRLGVSLSAGLVEETFFRGFLQPRIGIGFSTLLFVLAHLSYEQPLMLVGITLLSVIFAALVRWRQNVWAAITAHAVFDALQLLVIIPWAMRFLAEEQAAGALAALPL